MTTHALAALRHLDGCTKPCPHSNGAGVPCRGCLRKRLEYRAGKATEAYKARNANGSRAYYWRWHEKELARKRGGCWYATAARRAKGAGNDVERVCRWDIFEKTDGRCHLCGRSIDASLDDPNDPLYYTVDHVDPHANGGALAWDNLMPAHRFCNQRRGARILDADVCGEIREAFAEAYPRAL